MAKNTGEYGENKKPQMRPDRGTYGMCLPLLVDSATLPPGKRKRYPLMVPMCVLAAVNDLGPAASIRIVTGWPQVGRTC